MNEYGDSEPTEPTQPAGTAQFGETAPPTETTLPIGGSVPDRFAPTWAWTATSPQAPQQGPAGWPYPPAQSFQQSASYQQPAPHGVPGGRHASRRSRVLGTAAAVLLVGGAAAGGAAFGFAHANNGSSAVGIVGGTETPAEGANPPAQQTPGQLPQTPPAHGNKRGDGRASRFATPGSASASQSVGVVDINTRLKYQGARAAGTGMILTANGEVLTNNHVVEGATKIKVTVVSTGTKYVATVVGTDKVDDVAVLQLTGASGLSTVKTDTATLSLGQPVTAVGNAMGAGGIPSAAKGAITGLGRSITTQSEGGVAGERLTGLIQVDAQVVSGDSGGPLYNAAGQVIGMDTAASSSPARSTGYAIPITKALSIATQMENGQASANISLGTPAFLGVQYSGTSFNQSGAPISVVLPKTPAARAGITPGDVIKSVDGTTVTSGAQLHTLLSHYQPGQSVSISWNDTQGGSHTATVTLMAGPAE